jgi:uncharacterized protein (DUF2235 family)
MKRLVICCDGTWNTPDQSNGGRSCPTNVTKLALAVAAEGTSGAAQRLYYHPGLGSSRGEHLFGGAFGYGLSRDVRSAYRFIVDNYERGDELYLFGFSRGAFTARSTAGLVRNAGVLRRENAARLDDAYALYRDRASKPRDIESALFRRSYSHETESFHTRIRFIGVWDTVGALGIPSVGPKKLVHWINKRWSFHDTRLSSWVDGAFHALAIDEKRRPFEPTLWTGQAGAGQEVEQVWFAGVHGDVGGGYPDASLADIALWWMADRAARYGLAFRQDAFTLAGGWGAPGSTLPVVRPDPGGEMHETWKHFYRLQPPLDRLTRPYPDAVGMRLSSTAAQRGRDDPHYQPPGLQSYLGRPGEIIDIQGRHPAAAG